MMSCAFWRISCSTRLGSLSNRGVTWSERVGYGDGEGASRCCGFGSEASKDGIIRDSWSMRRYPFPHSPIEPSTWRCGTGALSTPVAITERAQELSVVLLRGRLEKLGGWKSGNATCPPGENVEGTNVPLWTSLGKVNRGGGERRCFRSRCFTLVRWVLSPTLGPIGPPPIPLVTVVYGRREAR